MISTVSDGRCARIKEGLEDDLTRVETDSRPLPLDLTHSVDAESCLGQSASFKTLVKAVLTKLGPMRAICRQLAYRISRSKNQASLQEVIQKADKFCDVTQKASDL